MSQQLGIVDADEIRWRFLSDNFNTFMNGKFPENSNDADLDYFVLSVSDNDDFWFFKLFLRSCPKGMLIDLVIDVQMVDRISGEIHVDQRWQVNNLSAKLSRVNLYPSELSAIDKNVSKWGKSVTIRSVQRFLGFGDKTPTSHIIPVTTEIRESNSPDTQVEGTDSVGNTTDVHQTPNSHVIPMRRTSRRVSKRNLAAVIGLFCPDFEAEDSSEEVSGGADDHSTPQMLPTSLATVVTNADGNTPESSTQSDCSPNASGATASKSWVAQPIAAGVNGFGQILFDYSETQTEVPQVSYETLQLIATLVETQVQMVNTQTASKISELVAQNLRVTSTVYQSQLQLSKAESEAKMIQLQQNCDRLESQNKTLAEQLETERKSHQIENASLCERNADLEVKLIELQNRLQQQKQQPNGQSSMGNRDQQELANRHIEEKSKMEGNVLSSTVSTTPESSQPPSKRQKFGQSATDLVRMEP